MIDSQSKSERIKFLNQLYTHLIIVCNACNSFVYEAYKIEKFYKTC